MSWAKLDDGFWMHPKILVAGNAAAGVFARCLSYCGCYLTDGLIPVEVARTIAGADADALTRLEQVGLIRVRETGSIFIPDYLDYNRTKAQVEADREQRREAGRKGGQKSKPSSRPRAVA